MDQLGDIDQLPKHEHSDAGNRRPTADTPTRFSELPAEDLSNRALELRDLYRSTESPIHLDEAIELARLAVSKSSSHGQSRAYHLHILSTLLYDLYCDIEEIMFLRDSIAATHNAVEALSQGDENRAEYLQDLVLLLYELYSNSEEVTDLMKVLSKARQIIEETQDNHPQRGEYLNSLGLVLSDLYYHTKELSDLEQAIDITQQAVDLNKMLGDRTNQAMYLVNLAILLRKKYNHTQQEEDSAHATKVAGEAVEASEGNDSTKRECIYRLARILSDRFDATNQVDYLEKCIELYRQAIGIQPEEDPDWSERLIELVHQLFELYAMTGSTSYLDEAVERAQNAFQLIGETHKNRPSLAASLISGLGKQFEQNKIMPNLKKAVKIGLGVLEQTADDHPSRGILLNTVGNRFADLYYHSGLVTYLDKSITLSREAVTVLPKHSLNWFYAYSSIASGLADRYRRTNSISDLSEAISIYQNAADSANASLDSSSYALNLFNASSSQRAMASRIKDMTGFEVHIEPMRKALEMIHDKDPNRESYMSTFASVLQLRYDLEGSMSDLQEAVELYRKVLKSTRTNHVDVAIRMGHLASCLGRLYMESGDEKYLDEGIQLSKEAEERMGTHPERANVLSQIGIYLSRRYSATKVQKYRDEAIRFFQQALRDVGSFVRHRVGAGRSAMILNIGEGNWISAYEDSRIVVDLIPQLAMRHLQNEDKQDSLGQVNGLASDAAGLALQLGESAFVALGFLEKGRGVLALSLYQIRADLSGLRQKSPLLAEKFSHLRSQLKRPDPTDYSVSNQKVDLEQWYNSGQALDELIAQIRQEPGFEDFLLPPTELDIIKAADRGPIIILNHTLFRSDAIIVDRNHIRSLHLPELNRKDVVKHRNGQTFKSQTGLEWMWDCIAGPILNFLGFTGPPSNDDDLPHVWWIGTGLLSKFPIHAAGYHKDGCFNTVIDRVISSYSTSIGSIIRNRKPQNSKMISSQALLVAMEHTPGSSRLPSAPEEIACIGNLCPSLSLNPIEPNPSKREILKQLPESQIFHFAGHGYTHPYDPSQSYLSLHADKKECLSVANLLDLNLEETSPFLAYLSACGTGEIENSEFIDESIHLITGFRLAGFRHVIGTLWGVRDDVSVGVARVTYEGIRDKYMTDDSVAWGLHNAVRELRKGWLQATQNTKGYFQQSQSRLINNHNDVQAPEIADSLRNLILDAGPEDDGLEWIQYVHFGV